ncbi:MAG TPA: hypothetical protein VGM88_32675 [Kofleriaceae bacterium]|jgi:hypothetical protein
MNPKDKLQGEGDYESARKYDKDVRDFKASGGVEPAAKKAEAFVDEHPAQAKADEKAAKHGGALDGLVEKGKAVVDRAIEGAKHVVAELKEKMSTTKEEPADKAPKAPANSSSTSTSTASHAKTSQSDKPAKKL